MSIVPVASNSNEHNMLFNEYNEHCPLFPSSGVTPENVENMISSYELEMMTITCTNILREVLGPCAHCIVTHARLWSKKGPKK